MEIIETENVVEIEQTDLDENGKRNEEDMEYADNEDENDLLDQRKRSAAAHNSNRRIRSLSLTNQDEDDEDIKRSIKRIFSENDDDDNNQNELLIVPNQTKKILQTIENNFLNMQNKITTELQQIKQKVYRATSYSDSKLAQFQTAATSNEQFKNEVMHNGQNLLVITSRNISDYGRKVLQRLFTKDEIMKSILPPGQKHNIRQAFDENRFNVLHDAIRSKYRIKQINYDECYYSLVRPTLAQFIVDERRRIVKTVVSTNVSPPSPLPAGQQQQQQIQHSNEQQTTTDDNA
ncbi:unnamed protein product [Didymodactylos carnosus]|uniref:Uncharacterized protein n=1 Tax=Didymodactylos carnosus TaxID=1234261 RepID=A0A815J1Z6_9BILA|nr:unnamed protein product [Didymodactylos carnosus]CAF4261504.1 unnamed protein product [Didymodactylos carnosus]